MSNNNDKKGKPHIWIPDTEVDYVDYDPQARPKPLEINHFEHGQKLSQGLDMIKNTHQKKKTPISDDIVIFKVELHDGEKVDSRGDYQRIFKDNNLNINAIKKSNIAVVSTRPNDLKKLNEKLAKYIEKNGKSADFFQYVKSFSELKQQDKETKDFIKVMEDDNENKQDIQLTLIPNLDSEIYSKMFKFIEEKISEANGQIIGEPYFLSNNTPVYRVLMPSSGVNLLADQEIVYQVGLTPFFGNKNRGGGSNKIDISKIDVEFTEDPSELPIVCVLDDGIDLPDNLADCIAGRWYPDDISAPTTCKHGTKVASCAIFGDKLKQQISDQLLTPSVRVIDAVITDGRSKLAEPDLIRRIKKAVHDIKDVTKIFVLSFNQLTPIDDENISNISYELDNLMREYNIQFVLPTGNHNLWEHYTSLDDVVDDDSGKIASPGESFFGLTVGGLTNDENPFSISRKGELSPFSRFGLGFSRCQKPDVVYPGGNVYLKNGVKYITSGSMYVINNKGFVELDYGTSYSAPIAAADLALLTQDIVSKDPFIAKALLIHHAQSVDDLADSRTLEEREMLARLYGRGKGDFLNAQESFRNRATYIRRGSMSRRKKQRVKFYMPSTIAAESKRKQPVVKVTVTCISMPPVDNSKGYEYIRAYIDTSLKCINTNNKTVTRNPVAKEGRKKWQHVHHFSQILTTFNPGDYQIWLQLYTKPEMEDQDEVEFITIVTIEDLTGNDIDIYGGIEQETNGRFNILTEVELNVENKDDE
ncbi:S8 family serine peptidase [Heyndrickxia oleronia]|uniref:S8 family peptidase n=1 Tax=Heyndrickxia oleronia TaxID=38875 RepID=UPI00203FA515|nr:S8 family serine peptidase [Heyndrickxia oleronia]MCM3239104.1 S8 family serine peptidase [Heyndrickxia oleronia]